MATCDQCGKEIENSFSCNYCDGDFCSKHRLPPNHGCPGLASWKSRSGPSVASHEKKKSWISKKKESIIQNLSSPFESQETKSEESQRNPKQDHEGSSGINFSIGWSGMEKRFLKILKYLGGILFVLGCLIAWISFFGFVNIVNSLPKQFIEATSYVIPPSILSAAFNGLADFFSNPASAWENGAWLSVSGFVLFFLCWIGSKILSKHGRSYWDSTARRVAKYMEIFYVLTLIFWFSSIMFLEAESASLIFENSWPQWWFSGFLLVFIPMGLYMRRNSPSRGRQKSLIDKVKNFAVPWLILLIFIGVVVWLVSNFAQSFLKYLLYPLAFFSAVYIDYKTFKKVSKIGLYNTARQFGAFLLSIIMAAFGLLFTWSAFISLQTRGYFAALAFIDPLHIIYYGIYQNFGLVALNSFLIFIFMIGIGLTLIAGYLSLKYMKKVGVIIFSR